MNTATRQIHVIPSFHYDVAYLKSYTEYLPRCFAIIDAGLQLLEEHPEYRLISGLRWDGECAFVRVYEAIGVPAEGAIGVPEEFGGYALADGLQQPVEAFQACAGRIPLALRGFEVRGYLLRKGG